MTWEIREHPDFFQDLRKLEKRELEIFARKKRKIKLNPERQKHLSGGLNCYREPITRNIRVIYFIEGNTIWLLTIGRHDAAYADYVQRLHNLGSASK